MSWYNNTEAGRVEATVSVPERFNGYPGIVHGGIVAAILDEAAGRTLMLDGDFDNLFVTVKLDITFRRPTPTETPLTVVAWMTNRGKRKMKVAAQLKLADGSVTAECTSVVVSLPKRYEKLWEPERPFWKVDED